MDGKKIAVVRRHRQKEQKRNNTPKRTVVALDAQAGRTATINKRNSININEQECDLKQQQQCDNKQNKKQRQYNASKSAILTDVNYRHIQQAQQNTMLDCGIQNSVPQRQYMKRQHEATRRTQQ
jgi:hypothetical protein